MAQVLTPSGLEHIFTVAAAKITPPTNHEFNYGKPSAGLTPEKPWSCETCANKTDEETTKQCNTWEQSKNGIRQTQISDFINGRCAELPVESMAFIESHLGH